MSFAGSTVSMETHPDKDTAQVTVSRRGLKKIRGELKNLKEIQGDIFRKICLLLQSVMSDNSIDLKGSTHSHGDDQESSENDVLAAIENIKHHISRLVNQCSELCSENAKLRSRIENDSEHVGLHEMSKALKTATSAQAVIDRLKDEDRERNLEMETLKAQLEWQDMTIGESNEIIQILTETIKSICSYVNELEKDWVSSSRSIVEDEIMIRYSGNAPFRFQQWLTKIEDQISKLSSMFQSATTATLTGSCDDGTSSLSETSSLPCRISIPYSYSETEFVSNDDVRVTERLTAFNKPKCYQIRKSSVSMQLPAACLSYDFGGPDRNPKSGKSSRVVIGNKIIMATLWRRKTAEHMDVIALGICGWKSCSCSSGSCESECIGRSLILVNLTCRDFVLKKYYTVGRKELECEHYNGLNNALSGTTLVEDLNFCLADLFLSCTNASSGPEDGCHDKMDGVDFSVSTVHLAYDQKQNISGVTEFTSPAEKLELFRSSSHMSCVDIVFRLNCPKPEIFKACDCVLKPFSPLIHFVLGNSRKGSGAVEFILEDTSSRTMQAFLNYVHGMDNGMTWREDVALNLEMLEFAYHFFMPEIAQLSTDNLLVNPDENYGLDLVLKLQSAARKYQNYELEGRAREWLRRKTGSKGIGHNDGASDFNLNSLSLEN